MIKRFVRFGQNQLAGVLHSPSLETSACTITCHGFLSNKDGSKYLNIAHSFCEEGLAVFRFDFRGCGESKGVLEETTLTGRMEDLRDALNFIEEQGFEKIGVMGSSLGGCVSILTAAKDERIKALATWATPSYLNELFSRKTIGRFQKFLNDMEKYDIIKSLRRVKCPIIIIHGSLDDQVPLSHARVLYRNANEPKDIQVIEDADHRFTNTLHRKNAVELTLKWFKKHLRQK